VIFTIQLMCRKFIHTQDSRNFVLVSGTVKPLQYSESLLRSSLKFRGEQRVNRTITAV